MGHQSPYLNSSELVFHLLQDKKEPNYKPAGATSGMIRNVQALCRHVLRMNSNQAINMNSITFFFSLVTLLVGFTCIPVRHIVYKKYIYLPYNVSVHTNLRSTSYAARQASCSTFLTGKKKKKKSTTAVNVNIL